MKISKSQELGQTDKEGVANEGVKLMTGLIYLTLSVHIYHANVCLND